MDGMLLEVEEVRLGSQLITDAATGTTEIQIADVTDFSDDGGRVMLGEDVYDYDTVVENDDEEATGTLTLASGLTEDLPADEPIWVMVGESAATDVNAVIDLGLGDGDAVSIPIDYVDRPMWPVQVYEPPLPVVVADDLSSIEAVPGATPVIDGSYIDPDTLPPAEVGTDGEPPEPVGPVQATGGVGTIHLRWDPVINHDPVTYLVYGSTETPVVADAAHLVATTVANFITVPGWDATPNLQADEPDDPVGEPITGNITNPSFEDGTTGWDAWDPVVLASGPTSPLPEHAPEAATDGTGYALATCPSDPDALDGQLIFAQYNIPAAGGTRIAGAAQVAGTPDIRVTCWITPTIGGVSQSDLAVSGTAAPAGSDWTKLTVEPVTLPADADGYHIEFLAADPSGAVETMVVCVDNVAIGSSDSDDGGLVQGTTYYFAVLATDTDGNAAALSPETNAQLHAIDADDFAANYVYAGQIMADQIVGGAVTTDLLLAANITTGEPGQARVGMGPDGIALFNAQDEPIVVIPTDPNQAATFAGDVVANTLTSINGASFEGTNNEISRDSGFTLAVGARPPQKPPEAQVSVPTVMIAPADAIVAGGGSAAGKKIAWTTSRIMAGATYHDRGPWAGQFRIYQRLAKAETTTGQNGYRAWIYYPATGEIVAASDTSGVFTGSTASNDTYGFYLQSTTYTSGNDEIRMRRIGGDTGTISVLPYGGLSYYYQTGWPCLTTDPTTDELWVVDRHPTTGTVRLRRLDQDDGRVLETRTMVSPINNTNPVTAFAIEVLDGVPHFVVGIGVAGDHGYLFYMPADGTDTGEHLATETVYSDANSGLVGIATIDGALHTLGNGSALRRHDGERIGVAEMTYYTASTLRRADPANVPSKAAAETTLSAARSFTMQNRARLTLTAAEIPVIVNPDDPAAPDSVTIYVARGAAPADPTDWYRQDPPPVGVRQLELLAVRTNLGGAPAESTFPEGEAGYLHSARLRADGDPSFSVNGSGRGRFDAIMPPGVILDYGGDTAPEGFLMCDGSAVSRSLYPDLFIAIGTKYGAGDGSTTFNLPPSGVFMLGADATHPVGKIGGSSKISTSQLPEHDHNDPSHDHAVLSHTHNIPGHNHGMTINFRYMTNTQSGGDGSATRVTQIAGTPSASGTAAQGDTNTQNSGPWTSGGTSGERTGSNSGGRTGTTGSGADYLPPYATVNRIIRY